MVRISIRLIRISFECFEFAFKFLESLSNGSNVHSIASNLVRMFRIGIRMEFAFDCFEFRSNGLNLHLNV